MPLRLTTSPISPMPAAVASALVRVRQDMFTVLEALLLLAPARIVARLPTIDWPPEPVVAVTLDSSPA